MNDQPAEKTARNAEIVRLHVEGRLTLTAIGERYGITKERVRVLVRRTGVSPSLTRAVQTERSMDGWVEQAPCEWCGRSRPSSTPPRLVTRFCSKSCAASKWADAQLLDELRRLALLLRRTPGMKQLVSPWPTPVAYYKSFGSLTRAQELAGLTPNAPGYHGHNTPLPDGFREQWAHLA